MRLCVLTPNQEYMGQAGVRIRYLRIAEHMRFLGHELTVQVIDQFHSAAQFTHDAYVFSKCYDARCFVIGRVLRDSGRLVGIDMFDDYFSQHDNSRFLCHRDWLREMSGLADFFLCSTPRMREVVAQYLPGKPGHILNDPFDAADPDRIGQMTQANLESALTRGQIDVAWFGVGDNPHFAVGLHDLCAYGHGLALLGRGGLRVRLRILTNRRALTAEGLEMLGRLPVRWSLDEWSVAAEHELLARSLLSFIPVNAQTFSIAKSLNRAVSAVTSGTQVLSNGYPLYRPLGAFIYRDPRLFLSDMAQRNLKLRPETVPGLMDLLATYGDPVREARDCSAFLTGLLADRPAGRRADDVVVGLVHGVKSPASIHKFAQRIRHLSIASPFSARELNVDLRFLRGESGALIAQFSDAASVRIRAALRSGLVAGSSATGRPVQVLEVSPLLPEPAALVFKALSSHTRAEQLASYASVMEAIGQLVQFLLRGVKTHVSETEPPFRVGPGPVLEAA